MLKSLALAAALGLTLAACATAPSTPDKATANAKPAAACVGQTATRLPMKDDTCAGFGNTYSQQDLNNTGQPFADKALGMLDPSVRVGH